MSLRYKILIFCFIFFVASTIFATHAFLQFPLSKHYKITQYVYDDYTLKNGLPTYVYGNYKHSGTDYDVAMGNPVYAAIGGKVVKSFNNFGDGCSANNSDGGGYGNHIVIEHSNGYYTLYGHMKKGSVKVGHGDVVDSGDIIGLVGSSGFSMGSDVCGTFEHLHFEVSTNMYSGYVNPYNLDTGCLFLGGCGNPQLPGGTSSSSSSNTNNSDTSSSNNNSTSPSAPAFSLNHIGWLDAHSNHPKATHLSAGNFGGSVQGFHLATNAIDQDVYFYGEWNGNQIYKGQASNQLSRIEGKGKQIQDMVSGKFEGGSKEYLAVVYKESDIVYFYYNDQRVGAVDTHGGRPEANQITAGDIDNDGKDELFVSTKADDHIYMFDTWHEDSIGFTMDKIERNWLDAHSGNPTISALSCMDIDSNGYDELMVATENDDHVYEYFYTNNKNWRGQIEEINFNKQGYADGLSGGFIKEMIVGKFKGNDGVRDYLAVLTSNNQNEIYFYWERDLGKAWGGLLSKSGYIRASDGNNLSDLAASDINPNSEGEELILATESNDHINFFGNTIGEQGGSNEEFYDAKVISQSDKEILLQPGQEKELWIEYENTGDVSWFPGKNNSPNLITTYPHKRNSIFKDRDWTDQWQPTLLSREVKPRGREKYKFKIKAPQYSGKFREIFALYNGQNNDLYKNSLAKFEIYIDGEIPTKVKSLRGDKRKTNWQQNITRDATPSFSWDNAYDAHSGIDGYYVAIDDVTPDGGGKGLDKFIGNKLLYSVPQNLSEGWHVFAVTSKDRVGNVNPSNTNRLGDAPYLKFLIDKTPPTQVKNFKVDESKSKWVSTGIKSLNSDYFIKSTSDPAPRFIWQKATDNLSGVAGYYIAIDDKNPNGKGNLNYKIDNINSFVLPENLSEGKHTVYIRPFDKAGNRAQNIISHTFVVDRSAPRGSVEINKGAIYTNDLEINLDLKASDLSPIVEYRISSNAKNWRTYSVSSLIGLSSESNWNLENINGTRTVYVQFKDALGHLSSAYYDSIFLDNTNPVSWVNGLPTWHNSLKFFITWYGEDNLSGIKWFDVQYRENEEDGWMDWLNETTLTSKIFEGIDGITYYFRSRAKDVAGNREDYSEDYEAVSTVDITAPDPPVILNPERNASFNESVDKNLGLPGVQVTFTGIAEKESKITLVNLSDNGQIYSTKTNLGGNWSIANVNFVEGENIIEVTAEDVAQNSNTSGDYKYFLDTILPSSITDLTITDITYHSLNLEWTASGDDGREGIAQEYDIRYSNSKITEENFESATPVINPPLPEAASTYQVFVLDNLKPKETYYVAVRIRDEVFNWSEVSNIVNAYTPTSANSITLQTSSNTVMAEGKEVVDLEVKILDHEGNTGPKLSGEPVTINITDDNGVVGETGNISAITDHGDGIYKAQYVAATKVGDGQIEIMAENIDCATVISTSRNINLIPGNPAGSINLIAVPNSLNANGSSVTTISSDVIRDQTGNQVVDGQEVTVSTNLGTIITPDRNVGRPGTQILILNGRIEFKLRSSRWNGYGQAQTQARIVAQSVLGSATGVANIVFRDVTVPTAPHIENPSNGLTTNNNRPTISGRAEKNSRILIYKRKGSGAWRYHYHTNTNASGVFSYRFGSELADNNWTFRVKARDAASNTSSNSNSTSITIDTSKPGITGYGPTGTLYHRANTIWATYSDMGSGIDTSRIRIRVNSVEKSPTSITNGRIEFRNTFADENRTYNIELEVYDRAGNRTTQNWSFNIQIASFFRSQVDSGYKTSIVSDWPYTRGRIPAPRWWDPGFNDSSWNGAVYGANLPPSSALRPCSECEWIWGDSHVNPNETTIFRKRFTIPSGVIITDAAIRMSADNEAWGYVGYINGNYFGKVPESGSGDNPHTFGLERFLHAGNNLLAVQTSNGADDRAGLAYTMTIRYHD